MSDKRIDPMEEQILTGQADQTSDKEKVVQHSVRQTDTTQEDVSRSTLHYGEHVNTETARFVVDDHPQFESITPSAGLESDVDAATGTPATDSFEQASPVAESGVFEATVPASDRDASGALEPNSQSESTEREFTIQSAKSDTGRLHETSPSASNEPAMTEDPSSHATSSFEGNLEPVHASAAASQGPAEPPQKQEIEQAEHLGEASLFSPYATNDTVDARPHTKNGQKGETDVPPVLPQSVEDNPATPEPVVDDPVISISRFGIAADRTGTEIADIELSGVADPSQYSFSVSDDRFEISDGILKLKPDVSLAGGDANSLDLEISAVGPSDVQSVETASFEVINVPEFLTQTGFNARYFDVDQKLQNLSDINWSGPASHEELVETINYENSRGSFWDGGSTDTFGAQITGTVDVNEEGTFKFFLGGDDGVVLFVNGQEVVRDDGLHGYRTRDGEIQLEPGTHHIEVRYFENYGHAGLKLEWQGPGLDGRELVTDGGMDAMNTLNGVPVSMSIQMTSDAISDGSNTTLSIEGLPGGTTVLAGENVLDAGADGAVDVTGWDLALLTVSTPQSYVGEVPAQLVTTVQTANGVEVESSEDIGFTVELVEHAPQSFDISTGFHASYFDVDTKLSKLDQIDWDAPPTHEDVVSEINYKNSKESFWEGGSKDTFGARITGQIDVEEGGVYEFFVGGDDGVMLIVDGEEVVDNDGLHGFRTRNGEIELEPGTHDIEVRYFENYGHAGLKLEWSGPDTDGRELVSSQSDLSIEENGMIALGIESEDLSEAATFTLSGLPSDTIVMSGDMIAVSDGSQMDLTGWNMDMVEIAPPPGFEGTIEGEFTSSDSAFNGDTLTTQTSFSIEVGDPDAVQNAGVTDDQNWALTDDTESAQSWLDVADDQNDGTDNADPLDEEVIAQVEADTVGDANDTYERSDW
ncbi:MAG: PA14 domain-containing protein [Pseudomonadota bacterium]